MVHIYKANFKFIKHILLQIFILSPAIRNAVGDEGPKSVWKYNEADCPTSGLLHLAILNDGPLIGKTSHGHYIEILRNKFIPTVRSQLLNPSYYKYKSYSNRLTSVWQHANTYNNSNSYF